MDSILKHNVDVKPDPSLELFLMHVYVAKEEVAMLRLNFSYQVISQGTPSTVR